MSDAPAPISLDFGDFTIEPDGRFTRPYPKHDLSTNNPQAIPNPRDIIHRRKQGKKRRLSTLSTPTTSATGDLTRGVRDEPPLVICPPADFSTFNAWLWATCTSREFQAARWNAITVFNAIEEAYVHFAGGKP